MELIKWIIVGGLILYYTFMTPGVLHGADAGFIARRVQQGRLPIDEQ